MPAYVLSELELPSARRATAIRTWCVEEDVAVARAKAGSSIAGGSPGFLRQTSDQWPFQDPIYWRYLPYIRPKFQGISPQNMAKHMVLTYLHFRILEFPLIRCFEIKKHCNMDITHDGSMVLLYMVRFTINIPQMLAYIAYMDHMGNNKNHKT